MVKINQYQNHLQKTSLKIKENRSFKICLHCNKIENQKSVFSSKDYSQHFKRKHLNGIKSLNQLDQYVAQENIDYIYKLKEGQENDSNNKITKSISKNKSLTSSQSSIINTDTQKNLTLTKDAILNLGVIQQNDLSNNLSTLNNNTQETIEEIQKNKDINYYKKKVQQQKEMILNLLSYAKIINLNESSKTKIIEYGLNCSFSNEEIQKLKQNSKRETNKIEFTSISIRNHIQNLQENTLNEPITNYYMIHEFIGQAQKYLMSVILEFQKIFEDLIQQQNINFQQFINTHPKFDLESIQKKHYDDMENQTKIFQFYEKAQEELKQLKQMTWNSDHNIPSIGINGDIFKYNFLKRVGEIKFDVLEIDYPWPLNFKSKKGKKFLNYQTLNTSRLFKMEIEELQDNGFLFMWTISSKFSDAEAFMYSKGYKIVETLVWLKLGKSAIFKNRQGYYMRHSKEICLVGLKGQIPRSTQAFKVGDVIATVPGKNSEKPVEIKYLIEKMVPDGAYCELFGRKNNLRDGWVTIGNEL